MTLLIDTDSPPTSWPFEVASLANPAVRLAFAASTNEQFSQSFFVVLDNLGHFANHHSILDEENAAAAELRVQVAVPELDAAAAGSQSMELDAGVEQTHIVYAAQRGRGGLEPSLVVVVAELQAELVASEGGEVLA